MTIPNILTLGVGVEGSPSEIVTLGYAFGSSLTPAVSYRASFVAESCTRATSVAETCTRASVRYLR